MSKKKKSINLFYGFLILLTLVNLLQAYHTELILDEAYYWYLSKNIDWGYFDHPPMVVFLVKIGYTLFENELGVRFFSSFLLSGTIYFLWLLIDNSLKYKNIALFCSLTASVALFNVYGFFMLPDTPLLFFAALFLWSYKQFLKEKHLSNILFLGISMAAMMYSKYHAVLLIGFIVLSNLKLLLKKEFWMATFLALILYSPHLYWLYENDFNSLKYHLIERANSTYKISYTLDYLAAFFAVIGLAFPLVYWGFYKHEKRTTFSRGLAFVVYGIFIFFLISSFNRRTQAQWTLLVILPLIIMSFNYALHHSNFKKWLLRLSIITIVLMCFLRFAIINEHISPIVYESHGNKEWVQDLYKKTKGKPIVFRNSYTDASMYTFYSGVEAISANGFPFRKNQYDLDSSEFKFRHKNIAYVSTQKGADSTFGYHRKFKNFLWKGVFLNDFYSWRKLEVTIDKKQLETISDSIVFAIKNPYNEKIPINKLNFFGLTLTPKKAVIDTLNIFVRDKQNTLNIPPYQTVNIKGSLKNVEKLKEGAFFRITIRENNLSMGFQGNIVPLK